MAFLDGVLVSRLLFLAAFVLQLGFGDEGCSLKMNHLTFSY